MKWIRVLCLVPAPLIEPVAFPAAGRNRSRPKNPTRPTGLEPTTDPIQNAHHCVTAAGTFARVGSGWNSSHRRCSFVE